MRAWHVFGSFALATLSLGVAAHAVDFDRDVRPILAERCVSCHGPLAQEAGLRLDAGRLVLKGSSEGAVVVPGDAKASKLLTRVTAVDHGERMPPEGKPLDPSQIDTLAAWIAEGAAHPADERIVEDPKDHWFYRVPIKAPLPEPRAGGAVDNAIDRFLDATRAAKGLTPVDEADRATLLRRVTVDLTGLTPTRAELHAYLADESPDAYERVVDRLLASPGYGERWGRHWMDVWRYNDHVVFGADEILTGDRHLWKWRDWIVDSVNAGKTYDRMVQEMLAGDELAPDDEDALRATGYIVRNKMAGFDGGGRDLFMNELVEHTAQAFLGTTLRCCRCHDHKYDPIPQVDYYRVRAFFEPIETRLDRVATERSTVKDGVARVYDASLDPKTYLYKNGIPAQKDESIAIVPAPPTALRGPAIESRPVELPRGAFWPATREYVQRQEREAVAAELAAALTAAERERHSVAESVGPLTRLAPLAPYLFADARVFELEADALRAKQAWIEAALAADVARFAGAADYDVVAQKATAAHREHDVAKTWHEFQKARRAWLKERAGEDFVAKSERDDVLRVAAETKEKAWKEAVARRNEPPTSDYRPVLDVYPNRSTGRRLALARWITARENPAAARVAVNHVWMRHFGRPLVDSVFDFGLNGRQPTHPELLDWLAVEFMDGDWSLKRIQRLIVTSAAYRMRSEAESNDNERLDPENVFLWRANPRRMESEAVRDCVLHVAGALARRVAGEPKPTKSLDREFVRSMYFRHSIGDVGLLMTVFDGADPNECYRRNVSVVPQQALALVNSRFSFEQARLFSRRVGEELGAQAGDDAMWLTAAMETLVGRPPTTDEATSCMAFLKEHSELAHTATEEAKPGDTIVPPHADPKERARESLAHVLINHNDFQTVR